MSIQLLQGDCIEVMKTLPAQSVEAIITDLPYGTTACAWDEVIPFAPMWEQVKRVLKPRGVFVTTASQPFTSKLVMSNLEWFKYCWVWDKVKMGNFLTAKIKPLMSHEDICVFSSGNTANCSKNNMSYFPQMEKRYKPRQYKKEANSELYARKNTISIEYKSNVKYPKSILRFDRGRTGMVHPTQKPVSLYEYLILTYTNPGDTVLDICAGSGTTGEAAIKTGRNCILIEKKPEYFGIIQNRMTQVQAQPLLFEVRA
jgi:site-specific DNA-methyltransferase (adenine-specific)